MPKYLLLMDYYGNYSGQALGPWKAGDEAELDEETAAWMGRDCPGCIGPADEPRAGKKGKDRQMKAAPEDREA